MFKLNNLNILNNKEIIEILKNMVFLKSLLYL